MDSLLLALLTESSPVNWMLFVLLLVVVKRLLDIIWIATVSSKAEFLSKKGINDVVISRKGVSLVRRECRCRTTTDVNQKTHE